MKKNFIKIVVVSITTLTLLFTFINVNATIFEDYTPTNGTQTLPLKTWDDITEPNDLLGVTLLFNDIIYPIGLSYNAEIGSFIDISYTFNSSEYELESMPFLWGCGNDGIQIKENISIGSILRLEEEYYTDCPLTILCNGYELFSNFDPNYEYRLHTSEWYKIWEYGPRMISFPFDQRDNSSVQLELIVTGQYIDSRFESPWQALFAFLRRNTTIIYSSAMASDLLTLDSINAYNEGYNLGYSTGYHDGFHDGELNSSNEGYRFTFLTGIFNAVSDLLSIEIFPNVQLGYFVFIPLALGITGMIFWFWRKD